MRYRLTAPHYLKDTYYPAGAEVEWRGVPSSNMEALDDGARAALKKFKPRGFDINVLAPMTPPPKSLPGSGDEASVVYPSDPAKQQAMRERTAKARAAAAAAREAKAEAEAKKDA